MQLCLCLVCTKKKEKSSKTPLTCGTHFSVQLKQKIDIIPHLPSIPAKDFDYDYVGLMTVAEGLRVAVMQQGQLKGLVMTQISVGSVW